MLNIYTRGQSNISLSSHINVLKEISESPPILIMPSVEFGNLRSKSINENNLVGNGDDGIDEGHVKIVPQVAAIHGTSNDVENVNKDQVENVKDEAYTE